MSNSQNVHLKIFPLIQLKRRNDLEASLHLKHLFDNKHTHIIFHSLGASDTFKYFQNIYFNEIYIILSRLNHLLFINQADLI